MRNKIMMLVLLCALLVGLVPPSSARAEVEGFPALPSGWSYDYYYGYCKNASNTFLYGSSSPFTVRSCEADDKVENVSDVYVYKWNGVDWVYTSLFSAGTFGSPNTYVVLSNHNIYDSNGALFFEQNFATTYSFDVWCLDANLNCRASSYESSTVLPYVFNDYVHVVRRTGTDKYGRWVLTTIGNSIIGDNLSDYTLMVDDNGELQVYALYSGEEEQGYQLFVRNYVYDTDGWKLISFELFDTREDDDFIIELGEDSAINDANLLAYTSVDIYDDGLNLLHSASTEFYDVNDVLPDVPEQPEEPQEPSVAPTSAPSNPSGGSGAEGGGVGGGTRPEGGSDDSESWLDKIQGTLNDIKDMFSQDESMNGSVSELTSTLKDMFGVVSVVPLMIGAVFGFLPSWCLVIVGASFAFMAIYLVVKLIRG